MSRFEIAPEHQWAGLETAVEYASAGLWRDAMQVASKLPASALTSYWMGYFNEKTGDPAQAKQWFAKASSAAPDLQFPFQTEMAQVLRRAIEVNPKDARAHYYLGNLLYDLQPEEAVSHWETSRKLDPSFAIVHRNLGSAYARQEKGLDQAIASLEQAVATGRHPIHFFELDGLYEAAGAPAEKRLAVLEKHRDVVTERDDATARLVALEVWAGKYDDAIRLMTGRRFNVWEGGARFSVHDNWTDAHLLRGRSQLAAGRPKEAVKEFETALDFPSNLQVARFRTGGRFAEGAWWRGVALEAAGDAEGARKAWTEAAARIPDVGNDDILPATDRTVLLYYQALATRKLGQEQQATALFRSLIRSGTQALNAKRETDFFAKFGDAASENSRRAQAHYIRGLGHLGLGEKAEAQREFGEALQLNPAHTNAKVELAGLSR
jgi:tetratricopeptide (TPR) repeat protein